MQQNFFLRNLGKIAIGYLGIVAILTFCALSSVVIWYGWNNWIPWPSGQEIIGRAIPGAIVLPSQYPPAVPEESEAPAEETVPQSNCSKHGQQAWSDSTNTAGHGRSPVGGLEEDCWIMGETWGPEGYVFVVKPGTVAWLTGHYGGTAWFIAGGHDATLSHANESVRRITERDGVKPTLVDLSVGQTFRLLDELQIAPRGTASDPVALPPTPTPAPLLGQQLQDPTPTPTPPTAIAGKCEDIKATGPAILEYGDSAGTATVVKLNEGETSPRFEGGCYPFTSQSELDTRWPDHKKEFLAKFPNGQTLSTTPQ